MISTPTVALPRIPSPKSPLFISEFRNSNLNLKWGGGCIQFPQLPSRKPIQRMVLPSPAVASDVNTGLESDPSVEHDKFEKLEVSVEKVIYSCRFFAILAVWGSLVGSFLCFFKGCVYVVTSFQEYFVDRAKVIATLVEATDVYLLGTVMLVFGMGLYELFISNLDKEKSMADGSSSNLYGLFALKERPRWLEVKSVNELKTKLGHVIVMLLLIGLFDKSKRALITSPVDLLCFSASIFLSAGCLFLLSKLND